MSYDEQTWKTNANRLVIGEMMENFEMDQNLFLHPFEDMKKLCHYFVTFQK